CAYSALAARSMPAPHRCDGMLSLSFFFQAADGIRGRNVTGVQTCALPISRWLRNGESQEPFGIPHCAAIASKRPPRARVAEVRKIGRASCRERVWTTAVTWTVTRITTGACYQGCTLEGRLRERSLAQAHAT